MNQKGEESLTINFTALIFVLINTVKDLNVDVEKQQAFDRTIAARS